MENKVKRKSLKVFLTGGLGNQLFQISAAMHFANSRRIELDLKTANPRTNLNGNAELLTLKLPTSIDLTVGNQGGLTRRVFGFNLRSGYSPRRFEQNMAFRITRSIISSLVLSFLLKKPYIVKVSNDLGYDETLNRAKSNQILIGYFQTHIFAKEVLEIKESIFSDVCDDEFLKYKLLALEEIPLLVHVRLGDYKSEDKFGILTANYYECAIKALWEENKFKKIWLFSDEPNEALQKIPNSFRGLTRIMNTNHLDSAETLRIMTLCGGYVIANSTFSWWAAFLRENLEASVIAPKPWFLTLPEPVELIPPDWRRLSGF
jgi:hypothetical protein